MVAKARKGEWIIFVFLVPLFLLLLPFYPFFWLSSLYQKARKKQKAKKFLQEHTGKTLFFYKQKNGWGTFISNNMLPVLSESTQCFDIRRDNPNPLDIVYFIAEEHHIPSADRKLPFLLKIRDKEVSFYSFHTDFNLVKKKAKLDLEVQEKLKARLIEIQQP